MIQVIIALTVIATTALTFFCWITPRKIMRSYAKQIKSLGYTVLEIPYNPFAVDIIATIRRGISQGDAMKEYKQLRSKYDVVIGNSLNSPRIQINHPDFIKAYYAVDKHYQYPKLERVVNIFSRIAGKGVLMSEGQVWKRKRNILNKIFNFDFVKSQTRKIASICDETLEEFQKQARRCPTQNLIEYNILDFTVRIFSSIMMELFLGCSKQQKIKNQSVGQFVKKLMTDVAEQHFKPINTFLGTGFTKLGVTSEQRRINGNIEAFREWGIAFIKKRILSIQQHLKNNPDKKIPEDIIEAIIMAQNNKSQNVVEQSITSEKQILQQFMIFLAAGTDTTSNFAQMMIYMVGCHPNVEQKIRSEIQKHLKQSDYSYENLKKLKYIDNVQKEVTRCFGPVTHLFPRQAKEDNYLNGLAVKKGTSLGVIAITNHYNPTYFKNPTQFRPERWDSQCNQLPNYVFTGFSGGARTCIGKHLALLQSKIAITKFLKRYKRIILPNKKFKMTYKFLYSPENFDTKMEINEEELSKNI